MRVKVLPVLVLLLSISGLPSRAQEPKPAEIRASSILGADGIFLTRAWRFAPGDGNGRESIGHDDSGWKPVIPRMPPGAVPADWAGVGWFRRHLLIEPALQDRVLALRLETRGAADVFLDGQLVLAAGRGVATGRGAATPELPSRRLEASLVTFTGPRHLLAIRYFYPAGVKPPPEGIGFELSIADPSRTPAEADPSWLKGLRGAVVALPAFLAFLHLALFWSDTRVRENLFYAVEMAAFALIVLREYREDLIPTESLQNGLDLLAQGLPVLAIFFGLLTYYAVRTRPYPGSWRPFAAASLVLLVASYAWLAGSGYLWIPLFAAVIFEVARIERSGRTVSRQGARFFTVSFAIFGFTIVLQVLVVTGLLESVAGIRAVYILGILASAAGMSFYLARTYGHSRLAEVENERKGRELAQARELQLSMLPRVLPRLPGLTVAASTHTAAEVGGDFYDLRTEGDGTLLVAFGDATGHGMAAGILVAAAKALFTALPAGDPLPQLLDRCGRALAEMNLPRLKMCLALARITPHQARVASAAMPPVLVHRAASGAVEELGAGGLPLGTRLTGTYVERQTTLDPGDTLLFASDGLGELRMPGGGELGYEGAARLFGAAALSPTVPGVIEALGVALERSRGTCPLEDDVTFLVVRVTAPKSGPSGSGPDLG